MSAKGARVRVRVPATSANLGPGFDVLGLALDLHNVFTVTPAGSLRIELVPGGHPHRHGHDLPRDESNLFYRAYSHLLNTLSPGGTHRAAHITMEIAVPPGRGLGSSATAVVGGLVAANTILGSPLTKEDLLPMAVLLERGSHADNVAPALLGGLVVTTYDLERGRHVALPLPFPAGLLALLLTPNFEMDTVAGRVLMPSGYTRQDTIYSTGRVALLLGALQTGRYDLMGVAMQDRLHQPYREELFPAMRSIISSALRAGAHGACLSGGGSSVLALCDPALAEVIGEAMLQAARSEGHDAELRALGVDREGAKAEML